MNYRKDNRSEKQFAKDIKDCTLTETLLMTLYVEYLNARKRGKHSYSFKDNGVDNDGNLIKDESKVTTAADFLLIHPNQTDRKIEIKFSRKNNYSFHFKYDQMIKYIEKDVCIVNFMGTDTEDIKFCIFTPAELQNALDNGKVVFFKAWGNKKCIKFISKEQDWKTI